MRNQSEQNFSVSINSSRTKGITIAGVGGGGGRGTLRPQSIEIFPNILYLSEPNNKTNYWKALVVPHAPIIAIATVSIRVVGYS
jgi:hypothetical protein